ncbi:MAG: hypothetical protein JWP13_504 [Candidatus Saccharibacteria bacterium]|nr:hypothetical protein [Candidatus Saccharibacteria bacterium]
MFLPEAVLQVKEGTAESTFLGMPRIIEDTAEQEADTNVAPERTIVSEAGLIRNPVQVAESQIDQEKIVSEPDPVDREMIYEIEADCPDDEFGLDAAVLAIQISPDEANAKVTDMFHEPSADIDEELGLMFDSETIEIYQQLTVLVADAEATRLISEISEVPEDGVAIELEPVIYAGEVTVSDFDAFLAARPAVEKSVTLAAIQEQANEQPLEQTLALLVEYISGQMEAPEQNPLPMILQEIKMMLPACNDQQETLSSTVRITPEMTEKLLILLSTLGYRNSGEVLVEFVSGTGIEFLFDFLEYICEITGDDRLEILMVSDTTLIDDGDETKLRLSKLLFGLIAQQSFSHSIGA